MKKYFIICFAAFILEVASTMYIKNVADKSIQMLFWAFIGPFLSLPFAGYMVESKNWYGRIKMALSQGIGYLFGAIVIYLFRNY